MFGIALLSFLRLRSGQAPSMNGASGASDIDGHAAEGSGERAGRRTSQSLNIVPHCCLASRVRSAQRGRLFMATFQLKHHSLNVPVVLVPTQELQAFLRVAPLQNLDGFLASAPRIHFPLIRHV